MEEGPYQYKPRSEPRSILKTTSKYDCPSKKVLAKATFVPIACCALSLTEFLQREARFDERTSIAAEDSEVTLCFRTQDGAFACCIPKVICFYKTLSC